MKLSIIGGGGFRVPLVYQALVSERMPLIDEVWLHDTSASRLAVIESVLSQLPHPIPVHGTTVLDQALEGSDFVFSAMRVGGLAGRIEDERTAIERDVIGQETTGPAGSRTRCARSRSPCGWLSACARSPPMPMSSTSPTRRA
jgi:6-phospho-beta-glucosidase